jgi:nitrate/nitrite-specific signal transduction histidine kinase
VAQQVIDAARYAEAINRAGQLRMLSQRLVKLYALGCAGIRTSDTAGLFADSLGQVDEDLAILTRTLSAPTFGDLLAAVLTPWKTLRAALAAPGQIIRLPEVDRLAEDMLLQAEQLTANLEVAGLAAALHVINVSGRQRMLSQRLAKAALMRELLSGPTATAAATTMAEARAELLAGLDYLKALPLSNEAIAGEVQAAMISWEACDVALNSIAKPASQEQLAVLSETLLGHFDRLTDHLERGMQALI